MTESKKAFETIVENEKILVTFVFSFFPKCLLPYDGVLMHY